MICLIQKTTYCFLSNKFLLIQNHSISKSFHTSKLWCPGNWLNQKAFVADKLEHEDKYDWRNCFVLYNIFKKFSSEIRYLRALSFRTDRLHSRRQYSFIVYICSVWGAEEERRLSQLLSGANKVEYTGFVDQGFYCRTDSEKMDSTREDAIRKQCKHPDF